MTQTVNVFLMCEETDGPILTYYWPIKLVFFADKKMTLFSYRPFQPEVPLVSLKRKSTPLSVPSHPSIVQTPTRDFGGCI